jgi:hypothetical protein
MPLKPRLQYDFYCTTLVPHHLKGIDHDAAIRDHLRRYLIDPFL